MKAWHFVNDTLRDGRPIPKDGEKLVHEGEIIICESGLHYSLEPFDALTYAPGNILCYVAVEGVADTQEDKGVARERTIIKRTDIEEHLWDFARKQALSVIHLWDAPKVVRQYLETGDESLRDAAWAAARAAARDPAWDAAWDAAWAAARDAAWAAARAAARAAQRKEFNQMIYDLFEVKA